MTLRPEDCGPWLRPRLEREIRERAEREAQEESRRVERLQAEKDQRSIERWGRFGMVVMYAVIYSPAAVILILQLA